MPIDDDDIEMEEETKRQNEAYERKKCLVCHRVIPHKFIQSVYDVPLFHDSRQGFFCTCSVQTNVLPRRFILSCMCWNTHAKILGTQYPNGIVTLGIRIAIDRVWDGPTQQVFGSMEELMNMLTQQEIIHEYSIYWIDAM